MKRAALTLLAAGLALTGCAGQPAAAPVTTSATAVSTTPAAGTTPAVTPATVETVTPTPAPAAAHLSIRCDDEDGYGTFAATPEEAWGIPKDRRVTCDAIIDPGYEPYIELSKAEVKAAKSASLDDEATTEGAAELYGMCAMPDLGLTDALENSSTLSDYDAQVIGAALSLCPDHPAKKKVSSEIKTTIDAAMAKQKALEEIEAGTRLVDGDYRVGKDIKPGTYVVESDEAFDGCYWSRLNKNGDIIQNNFINSGFRAQVTIRSTDYSFSTERCGEWVKQ